MKLLGAMVGCLLILVIAAFVIVVQPGSSGVVASLRLADGSEYMVVQRCNWSPEPYTVAFFMRAPGGRWGWCYIDHEANRWRDVSMTYDPESDVITITRQGTWQAALDRNRSMFSIGHGAPSRELAAPQDYFEPGFPFPP